MSYGSNHLSCKIHVNIWYHLNSCVAYGIDLCLDKKVGSAGPHVSGRTAAIVVTVPVSIRKTSSQSVIERKLMGIERLSFLVDTMPDW